MLKLALQLQHCFFPQSTQQCAFMNSAARLIQGRTLHSALRLPTGNWTPSARALGKDKDQILASWRRILLLCIDEISMVPADLFSETELRARQVKQIDSPWGLLSLLLTGDFLQLPPVAAVSLADHTADNAKQTETTSAGHLVQLLDSARGRRLWRDIKSCVLLEHSHRTHGLLQDFLHAMRKGAIPDHLIKDLLQRSILPHDQRLQIPKFWEHTACVGVLRHNSRAVACLWRAKVLASLAGERLLVCPAIDAYKSDGLVPANDPEILRYLCHVTNLTDTKKLPGFLYLWHGCSLCLEDKISEEHGLVRGCRGTLESVLFHANEPAYDPNPSLEPHFLQNMPLGLLLRIPGASFQQSPLLPHGICPIFPVTRDWKHKTTQEAHPYLDCRTRSLLHEGSLSISRRQLPCTNPLACTAYNLQGQEISAMLADLSRPPRMKRVQALVFFLSCGFFLYFAIIF